MSKSRLVRETQHMEFFFLFFDLYRTAVFADRSGSLIKVGSRIVFSLTSRRRGKLHASFSCPPLIVFS